MKRIRKEGVIKRQAIGKAHINQLNAILIQLK